MFYVSAFQLSLNLVLFCFVCFWTPDAFFKGPELCGLYLQELWTCERSRCPRHGYCTVPFIQTIYAVVVFFILIHACMQPCAPAQLSWRRRRRQRDQASSLCSVRIHACVRAETLGHFMLTFSCARARAGADSPEGDGGRGEPQPEVDDETASAEGSARKPAEPELTRSLSSPSTWNKCCASCCMYSLLIDSRANSDRTVLKMSSVCPWNVYAPMCWRSGTRKRVLNTGIHVEATKKKNNNVFYNLSIWQVAAAHDYARRIRLEELITWHTVWNKKQMCFYI